MIILDRQRDKAGQTFVLTYSEGATLPYATRLISFPPASYELGKYYKTERVARNCLMDRAGLAFDKYVCEGDGEAEAIEEEDFDEEMEGTIQ
jgi:hypothetical protein